jgi:hypothetical protein
MPKVGTVCAGDLVPFQPWNSTFRTEPHGEEVEEDMELDEALMALMKFPPFGI